MSVCVQTSLILQNKNGQKKMYTPVLEIIEYSMVNMVNLSDKKFPLTILCIVFSRNSNL
jgi:hypothetical protein